MSPETFSPADAFSIPWGRLALALALCAALTFALAVVLRRLHGLRAPGSRGRQLSLVDALPLGPKRAVYAIEAAGRLLVVAAAGDHVTLLTELPVALPVSTLGSPVAPDPEPAAPTQLETGPPFERVLKAVRQFGARREALS